jgi:uncharacterized protein (AIM24 family)
LVKSFKSNHKEKIIQAKILYRPSYSVTRVSLERREQIQVESGVMVGISPDMEMEIEVKGGFLKSISRSMYGSESFFMNSYTGEKDGDCILLAPLLPGDTAVVEMRGETLLVQSDSYLASSEGIQVEPNGLCQDLLRQRRIDHAQAQRHRHAHHFQL